MKSYIAICVVVAFLARVFLDIHAPDEIPSGNGPVLLPNVELIGQRLADPLRLVRCAQADSRQARLLSVSVDVRAGKAVGLTVSYEYGIEAFDRLKELLLAEYEGHRVRETDPDWPIRSVLWRLEDQNVVIHLFIDDEDEVVRILVLPIMGRELPVNSRPEQGAGGAPP